MMALKPVLCDVNESRRHFGPGDLAEGLLRGNSYLALKNVSCDYQDGVLTLRGRVPTYYLKQVATAVVAGVPGIERIINQIDVGAPAVRN